jgi:hypothetical protein
VKNPIKSFFRTKELEFLCAEEDWDVIPKPYPAKKLVPEWFKALPMRLGNQGMNSSTIKRCNPFMDAMSLGWIIPLAADVSIVSNSDCSGIEYEWSFYKPMVEKHGYAQVTTPKCPRPDPHKPPLKWINYWYVRPSPGYSVLFIPPLNRPSDLFTCFSGFVDSDKYLEYVNFPFVFDKPNFSGIVPAGTPLVQAIPIKRSAIIQKAETKKAGKKFLDGVALTRRRRASHESLYRDELREKKQ